jgi:hypothetical protein
MRNKLFISIISIVILGMSCFTLFSIPNKEVLMIENRGTIQLKTFNAETWLNTTFQDSLEKAFADHFFSREQWLSGYYTMNTRLSEAMNFINPVLGNERVKIEIFETINRVTIDQTRFLVPSSMPYQIYIKNRVLANVKLLNQLSTEINIPLFLYIIPQMKDSSLVYSEFDISPYKQLIKANLKIPYDYFKVYTLKEILKNYSRTDHHWTYEGAYQGYTDIAKAVFNEAPVAITNDLCFSQFKFYGSYSRSVANSIKVDYDPVCTYTYDYQPSSIKINGSIVDTYGGLEDYQDDKPYLYGKYVSHYERMFAGANITLDIDSGFIDKPNVLLIGNSFTAPIRVPLSYHSHHLYYYSLEYLVKSQPNFDLSAFIKENEIDQIIMVYQLESIRGKNLTQNIKVLLK